MAKQQEEARLRQVNCRLIGESCTCDPDVLQLPCWPCIKVHTQGAEGYEAIEAATKDLYDQRARQAKTNTASRKRIAGHRISAMFRLIMSDYRKAPDNAPTTPTTQTAARLPQNHQLK